MRERVPRTAVFAFLAAGGASFCSPVLAQADDLTVVEAVWTTKVMNRQPIDSVKDNSAARPLYFWTRLQGGPIALETLRREGKLPIVHQWVHSTVVGQEGEEVPPDQDDGKQLPGGTITPSGGLSATVNDFGRFRWRTWSHKESMWNGTWTVTVRYANGDPVKCGDDACQWTIELR